jgi:hypothetical protein
MSISVINPIGWAIERTKRVLFQPFDLTLWLTLGFCCFLAHLMQQSQGGCQMPPGNWGTGPGGGGPTPAQVQNAMPTIVAVGAILLLFIVGFIMLLTWLDSRGKFMFLDGVVLRRGAVVEPWKAFRAHGNSLFKFRVVVGFIVFVLIASIVAGSVAIAWPDIQAQRFGGAALTAIVLGSSTVVLLSITAAIIAVVLKDFIVPVMYARNQYCMPAWSIFRHELLAGRVGSFVLFYLMKLLLYLGVASIALAVTCATCCIAALPYVSSVVLLPLFVFTRCYPLAFIEQIGPEWAIIARPGAHYCRWCGYDLRYSDRSGLCPECGRLQDETAGEQPSAPPQQPE